MTGWMAAVAGLLEERTGLSAELTGIGSLERALESLSRQTSLLPEDLAGPLWESLIDEVVVPETWFFRDRDPFTYLARHAKENWADRSAKLLSACCSTGEEPYSIAITLLEAGLPPNAFRIWAADLSAKALATAGRAEYGKNSFRSDLDGKLDRYFTRGGSEWRVRDEVTRLVTFRQANLIGPMTFQDAGSFDAVFCRNALIYMRDEARKKALNNLRELLASDGILFAGHTEIPVFLQDGFERVPHARAFACRRPTALLKPRAIPARTKRPSRPNRKRAAQAAERVALPPSESSDAAIERARTLADQGKLEAAAALCEQLLSERRGDAEVYYLLGLLSQVSKREQRAEQYFERALYLDPRHYESLVHMSLLCDQRGESERGLLFRQRAERAAAAKPGTEA